MLMAAHAWNHYKSSGLESVLVSSFQSEYQYSTDKQTETGACIRVYPSMAQVAEKCLDQHVISTRIQPPPALTGHCQRGNFNRKFCPDSKFSNKNIFHTWHADLRLLLHPDNMIIIQLTPGSLPKTCQEQYIMLQNYIQANWQGQLLVRHLIQSMAPSRVGDAEKEAYLVRNKTPSVIWILYDQNPSKWSLEECQMGSTTVSKCQHIYFYILLRRCWHLDTAALPL